MLLFPYCAGSKLLALVTQMYMSRTEAMNRETSKDQKAMHRVNVPEGNCKFATPFTNRRGDAPDPVLGRSETVYRAHGMTYTASADDSAALESVHPAHLGAR
jgi:hypothetical protein